MVVSLRILAVVVVVLFTTFPAAAEPDARAKSRSLFVQGVSALEDTRPKDALVLFERAYELYPHYATLYNIGLCHRALGSDSDAANAFARYLDDGGGQVPAQDAVRVRSILAELDAKLAIVVISVTPAGTKVTVDGVPVAARTRRVDPGEHVVEGSAPGMQTARIVVTARAGERTAVALRLDPNRVENAEPAQPAVVAPPPVIAEQRPAPPPPPRQSRLDTTFWVAAGASVAGFATFGIAGMLARSEHSAYEGAATDAQADRHEARGRNLAAIADVGLGVGVVSAIVAAIVAMRPVDDPPRTTTPSRMRIAPRLGTERAGVDVAVSF